MPFQDEDGEIEGGIYEVHGKKEIGAAKAEVEQKRSELLDALRTSNAFCISVHDEKVGEVIHSSFILNLGEMGHDDAASFMVFASLKAINDLANFLEIEMDQAVAMLSKMVDDGVGKDWL